MDEEIYKMILVILENYIFLLALGLACSVIMYHFGLKPDWHVLREKKLISFYKDTSYKPLSMMDKDIHGKRVYFKPCCTLLLYSVAVSFALIFIVMQITNCSFKLSTFNRDINSYVLLFMVFSSVVGTSSEANLDNNSIKGILKYSLFVIARTKSYLIEHIVQLERKRLYKKIDERLTRWHADWKKAIDNYKKEDSSTNNISPKLGLLLRTLDGNYFKRIIPLASEELIDRFSSLKEGLIEEYSISTVSLSELKRFFRIDIHEFDVALVQINEVFEDIEADNFTRFDETYNWYKNKMELYKKREDIKQLDSIEDLKITFAQIEPRKERNV